MMLRVELDVSMVVVEVVVEVVVGVVVGIVDGSSGWCKKGKWKKGVGCLLPVRCLRSSL